MDRRGVNTPALFFSLPPALRRLGCSEADVAEVVNDLLRGHNQAAQCGEPAIERWIRRRG